jgi:6-phosphogluconate dehydrogenase
MIGLGRLGANMVRRLLNEGHQCVVFGRSAKDVSQLSFRPCALVSVVTWKNPAT